jgi:hypothetical protein
MTHSILISSNSGFLAEYNTYIKKVSYCHVSRIKIKNGYNDMAGMFQHISNKLCELSPESLRESVVLVDEYFDITECKPIGITQNKDNFWGRLILAFPEVEFIFQNKTLPGSTSIKSWSASFLDKNSFAPIFDFSGVRNRIKINLGIALINRNKKARIIEDETSFAYFHGYIAYKTGHKAQLFTSLNHLEQEEKYYKENKDEKSHPALQIQDLSLGFADKSDTDKIKYSDLYTRYEKFTFLKNIEEDRDFAITVGKEGSQVKKRIPIKLNDKWYHLVERASKNGQSILVKSIEGKKNNKEFLFFSKEPIHEKVTPCDICNLKVKKFKDLHKVELIYKPTKGIYHILEILKPCSNSNDQTTSSAETGNHSAEGILAVIAENLLNRAIIILENTNHVETAIHAAILAVDAKEMLNGLTPTLALQAFILQQKAEATAECLFAGTEYNILLGERFKDINKEVEVISKRFSPKVRSKMELNTRLSIVESLSGIYSTNRQFEEELECLKEARKLSIKLVSEKNKPYGFFLKLIDSPLNSIKRFAYILLLIQLFYGTLYYFINKLHFGTLQFSSKNDDLGRELLTYWEAITSATKYFFTSDANDFINKTFASQEILRNIVCGSQGFLVLTSVSLFMALIYQWLSRK